MSKAMCPTAPGPIAALPAAVLSAAGLLVLVGCGDSAGGAAGSLSVLLEPEDTITRGLEAGTGPEDLLDGWSARFDTYLVIIGNVSVRLATDESVTASASQLFAVDLTEVPASGLPLWRFEGLRAARWILDYEIGGGLESPPERHGSVSEAEHALLVAGDLTYLIEGEINSPVGRACPPAARATPPASAIPAGSDAAGNPCYPHPSVRFRFDVSARTTFTRCETDGLSGVAIPDGATATAALTIHGDHMFFNGFPESTEGGVLRLAQWLADSDLNLDGELVRQELEQLALADLPVIDERYTLGGVEVATAWEYLVEQLRTQGHLNGEGECSPL